MAHFAQIEKETDPSGFTNNELWVVKNVIVVPNDVEADGENWCSQKLGGTWKQTSYNGNIRGRYAAIGHLYNETIDQFTNLQPFASWTLNNTTGEWEAPITFPTIVWLDEANSIRHPIKWDEANQRWVSRNKPDFNNSENFVPEYYVWNTTNLTWDVTEEQLNFDWSTNAYK